MEVAEGIHRLTQGVVNFSLITDGGKLTRTDGIAEAVRLAKLAGRS